MLMNKQNEIINEYLLRQNYLNIHDLLLDASHNFFKINLCEDNLIYKLKTQNATTYNVTENIV